MRDAHRRIGGIYALPAGSGRAKDINAQILVLDLEIDLLEQRVNGFLEANGFGLRLLRHLGVFRVDELAGFRELVLVSLESVSHFDQRLEMPVLAAQRRHAGLVLYGFRIRELSLYLGETLDGVSHPVAQTQLSELEPAVCLPYFWRKRSTRPAVSTSFCLPVKKGWHAAQISV